jgi:hypothetical protein
LPEHSFTGLAIFGGILICFAIHSLYIVPKYGKLNEQLVSLIGFIVSTMGLEIIIWWVVMFENNDFLI